MTKIVHINNGACTKCVEIFDRFKGFHAGLRSWFTALQAAHPEAHVSCAGRGYVDQAHYFAIGTSFAQYGQSAHNYNLALDVFKLAQTGAEWPTPWYSTVLKPAVDKLNADAGATFKITWPLQRNGHVMEYPHCQVTGWEKLGYPLVEPKP